MKTHYDVLNLHKTCSTKEIKESFIKLSKLYHPDKNKSTDAHKKFVEVNEAYSVLGKPETRSQYDNHLMFANSSSTFRTGGPGGPAATVRTSYEHYANMYANNLKRDQENITGYFTTKRINMLIFCCLLVMIGSGLQMKAIIDRKRRHDQELARYLKESKEKKKKKKEEKLKEMEAALHRTPDAEN